MILDDIDDNILLFIYIDIQTEEACLWKKLLNYNSSTFYKYTYIVSYLFIGNSWKQKKLFENKTNNLYLFIFSFRESFFNYNLRLGSN